MNDRFKFRLWDKELNKYVYKNLFQNNCCEDENFQNGTIYFDDELTLEQPEQCTGLKDKNGKIIYEGDLISYDYNNEIYRIEFLNGEFLGRRFYLNIENLRATEFDYGKECQIIGNIHENSDLLK